MNLVSGKIVEIYVETGTTYGRVQVGTAFTRVPLIFIPEAHIGDMVLIESGVAISRIEEPPAFKDPVYDREGV